MKKVIMTAAVIACAATIVSAQQVQSANIVGYNTIKATGGSLVLPGTQFFVEGGGVAVVDLLGDNLPMGSKVYKWTGTGYKIVTYGELVTSIGFPPVDSVVGTNWTENGEVVSDAVLEHSEAFWVECAGSDGVSYDSVASGEVVLDASYTNVISAGLNMLSAPYPVEVLITDMGFDATLGDKLYSYTGTGYKIVTYGELVKSVGFPPVDSVVGTNWTENGEVVSAASLSVGEGFWYDSVSGSDVDWVMERPFEVE